MKILLIKLDFLKSIWSRKPLDGLFPQALRTFMSLNLSEYEAINQGGKQVPKYFNFANDVLDKWSKIEKASRSPNDDLQTASLGWNKEHSKLFVNQPSCKNILNVMYLLTLPGIISIPGTPQLTAKDIQYRLQVSKAKGIVTNDSLAPVVETISSSCPFLQTRLLVSEGKREGWQHFKELFDAAPSSHNCVQTRSDEPMTIFFTSGTTGSPKMVEHSQTSLALGLALAGRYWLDLKPSDVLWNMSNTGWVKASMGSVFAPWLRGTSVFIHNMPQFDPTEVLNILSRYPVTTICAAPTAYRMLVQQDLTSYAFKKLSHCLTAGEALNPEVMSGWKKRRLLNCMDFNSQNPTLAGGFWGLKSTHLQVAKAEKY